MKDQLATSRSEEVFTDYKPAYTQGQAVIEAQRCYFCHDAPCVKACPTAIDIPQFIRKIATGNVRGAAASIFEANILGMSCARVCPVEVLCVGDCVYNEQGIPPIQIGRLQRFATDTALASEWEFFRRAADSGKTIALVGGGPASLACAHRLSMLGHRCVIFEKRPLAGGLNVTGVAPYKMRADRALEELQWLLKIGGIEVRTEEEINDFNALEKKFDAVFIGLGLGEDSRLGIPGEALPGIHGAVEFIERLKLGTVSVEGIGRAVVIGGGNTAIDAVRELTGLGVSSVQLLYRGDEDSMSGYAHEWKAARIEGVAVRWCSQPTAFCGDGRVEGVSCLQTRDRRPLPGTDFQVEADLVLLAIGQSKLGTLLGSVEGVQIEKGRVVVDGEGATGRPGWYAGGDCANGGKEVVNAVAEGKRAALAMDRWLKLGGASA